MCLENIRIVLVRTGVENIEFITAFIYTGSNVIS